MTDPEITFVGTDAASERMKELREAASVWSSRPPTGDVHSRECGCSWTQVYGVLVRFLSRCDEHNEMCRDVEDWEVELVKGDG